MLFEFESLYGLIISSVPHVDHGDLMHFFTQVKKVGKYFALDKIRLDFLVASLKIKVICVFEALNLAQPKIEQS